ncbi:MAG: DUF3014 domain-containing protein [Gammaproteobacteria bacterium]|nr:DUF3014 domain-containing protein [Gammaproteobacteria bacterium]
MWGDDLEASARGKMAWLIGIVAAAAIALGIWYWSGLHAPPPAPPPPAAAPAPTAATEPGIQHPLAGAEEGAALPALNDSDPVLHDSLAGVFGRESVAQFLVPQNIVRHIVATVDNLPRRKLAVDLRPLKPVAGQTVTAAQGDVVTLSPGNYERYAPLARMLEHSDVHALVLVYRRLYPLFQQSYEDLGYPGKYFNDRVVEVIDHLLQTPEPAAPPALTRPRVFYEFADADLESRSAGQKLLLRMGPANEKLVKAKLRELRAAIASAPPQTKGATP